MKTVTTMLAAGFLGVTIPALAFIDGPPTPAEVSVAKCQRTTTKSVEKLAQAQGKAFRACADGASADYLSKTDISDATTDKCIASLRAVSDSRNLGKSAVEKAKAQIEKACDPGVGSNVHTLDDVLGGESAQVRQPIDARKLAAVSGPLGGPSTINTVSEYADATTKITTAKTQESLSKTIPNVPGMMQRVKEKVDQKAPPPTDPNLVADVKAALIGLEKRFDADGNGELDREPGTYGASCSAPTDCFTGTCVAGVCRCPNQGYTFTVNSSAGGLFTVAQWPGGTQTQAALPGCSVTIGQPDANVDLVCSLAAPFSIVESNGYSSCSAVGGEDGDGCQAVSCPLVGIPSCCNGRPSCSVGLNGSAQAQYFVQCVQ